MRSTDKILVICLILLSLTLTGLFLYYKSEAKECLANPFVYGAEKLKDIDCRCAKYTNPSCPSPFYFNDTSFVSYSVTCGSYGWTEKVDLNFSE